MDLETRTVARVTRRLVPFLILCYFVAYLDRVNVGFAALTMNKDLGLTAQAYGIGAGIFFLSYFLFEVPSNLFLERFGARKWIARIMFSWGLLSGCTAFIPQISAATGQSVTTVFYTIRSCSSPPFNLECMALRVRQLDVTVAVRIQGWDDRAS